MRMLLSLALMTSAATGQDGCPQTGSGTCSAATEVAVAIQNDLPLDLRQMRLMFAIAGGRSVVVGAMPMFGGPADVPADAAAYFCGHPVARAYLDGGGRIEVLMGDRTLLDLTTCGGR
jgi:hypothetical protein